MKADIAMIGLAVMGSNLALNIESKGYCVSVYNKELERVDEFISNEGKGKNFIPAKTYRDLVCSLKRPRKIMMMIKAGNAVDEVIEEILPYLSGGDIVIDGGNSHFNDTSRRVEYLRKKNVHFIGMGVSGGEEGALHGPSLMPGGSMEAWEEIKPIFCSIAAKAEDGSPCCNWMGNGGAGHFVKMVHNGIEYGDMQLICEAYYLLKEYLKLTELEIRQVFETWKKGRLNSYLIHITAEILGFFDSNGEHTLDKILDVAGQKGTGKWASIAALDEGVPLTLINEAVYARCLSAIKEERVVASKRFNIERNLFDGDKREMIDDIEKALYASKIISYAQGFSLLKAASQNYHWDLNFGKIALTWRGGCIIRSAFLGDINRAFEKEPALNNILFDEYFEKAVGDALPGWRRVVAGAVSDGYTVPAFASAITWFDGYTTERLSTNLLQAQRDYFGAHTYERIDRERGRYFHTDWIKKQDLSTK